MRTRPFELLAHHVAVRARLGIVRGPSPGEIHVDLICFSVGARHGAGADCSARSPANGASWFDTLQARPGLTIPDISVDARV